MVKEKRNDSVKAGMDKPDIVLFRSESKQDHKWVYGNLVQTADGDFIVPTDWYPSKEEMWKAFVPVDPHMTCQYTCLRDIHGQRIFDGDIIRFNPDEECVFYGAPKDIHKYTFEVNKCYDSPGYYLEAHTARNSKCPWPHLGSVFSFDDFPTDQWEIVGDILNSYTEEYMSE